MIVSQLPIQASLQRSGRCLSGGSSFQVRFSAHHSPTASAKTRSLFRPPRRSKLRVVGSSSGIAGPKPSRYLDPPTYESHGYHQIVMLANTPEGRVPPRRDAPLECQ